MVRGVGMVDSVFGIYPQAVWDGQKLLAPRRQEAAILVKNEDGAAPRLGPGTSSDVSISLGVHDNV